MTDRRDIGRDDTQLPAGSGWDGIERRTRVSEPTREIAEEALHEVRAMHRALHGEGQQEGVFEQLRSVSRAQGMMQIAVEGLDHKLDATIRASKEEARLASEQVRLANEQVLLMRQQAQLAEVNASKRPPLWLRNSALAGVVMTAAFFVSRLWHEVIGR